MTLPDYLNNIVLDSGKDLVWNKGKLTQQQLQEAGNDPYVVMYAGQIGVRKRFHQGSILGRLITLNIYLEPTASDYLPSHGAVEALWGNLYLAPEQVDEGLYGYDIIKLEYVGGFAPDLDERSSGLAAALRFDWWYSTQLAPKV